MYHLDLGIRPFVQRDALPYLGVFVAKNRAFGKGFQRRYPPENKKMTMEHQPFEDVFPIENGDIPLTC